ncbi:MAG: GNAT family N-acetyltransferase [Bacteroidia bacterium]|nr:GNAT family N-acetyltransferase [Bacteroidia bacterium]
MSEYRIERLNDQNLKDLIVLYKDCFGIDTTLEFLTKKYSTESFGAKYTGFIAYSSENEPAAYYGVFPARFTHRNRLIFCAQSGDTMTHSNHRKKGLFIKLANATFQLCRELGMEFIFGFPNDNSLPGFLKMGWKSDHHLNMYRVSFTAFPIVKFAKKYKKLFGSVYESWVDRRIKKYETTSRFLSNSCMNPELVTQIHDYQFFNYKSYFKKYLITTGGAEWYVRFDGRMFIGDFRLNEGQDIQKEFAKLKVIARKFGANEIETQMSPGSLNDKLFQTLQIPASKGINSCYYSLQENPIDLHFQLTLADADTF